MAALKFDVGDVPAMAVNAVLKRVAYSEKVTDGIASVYRLHEISSLAGKKERKQAECVQRVLQRLRNRQLSVPFWSWHAQAATSKH